MWCVSPMYRISLVWIMCEQLRQVLVSYPTCQSALILFVFPWWCWATVQYLRCVQWNFGVFSLTFSLRSLSFSHREIPVSLGHRGECTKCLIDVPPPALRKTHHSLILPAWLFWHQPNLLLIINLNNYMLFFNRSFKQTPELQSFVLFLIELTCLNKLVEWLIQWLTHKDTKVSLL